PRRMSEGRLLKVGDLEPSLLAGEKLAETDLALAEKNSHRFAVRHPSEPLRIGRLAFAGLRGGGDLQGPHQLLRLPARSGDRAGVSQPLAVGRKGEAREDRSRLDDALDEFAIGPEQPQPVAGRGSNHLS